MRQHPELREFMRLLNAGDIEGCIQLARVIDMNYFPDYGYIFDQPQVRTSAAILSAFCENPKTPSYWDFEHRELFNPHRLCEVLLDQIADADPEWHRYSFIVRQRELSAQTVINKCEALGWDNHETLLLAECESVDAAATIAANTERQDVIDALAARWGDDLAVLQGIAKNPRADRSHLEALAQHDDSDVRSAVAGNESTHQTVLAELAKDADDYVRFFVALNPSTRQTVLRILVNDVDAAVSAAAIINTEIRHAR